MPYAYSELSGMRLANMRHSLMSSSGKNHGTTEEDIYFVNFFRSRSASSGQKEIHRTLEKEAILKST